MKGKKGQITFIIIIVIVIIAGYGVMNYMRSSGAQAATEQAMQVQKLSAEKVAPVDDYLKSTLNLVAYDGLDLLGRQGGHIYASQDGISPDLDANSNGDKYLEYGEGAELSKVRYLVFPPKGYVPGLYYSKTPKYPWTTFPMAGGEEEYKGFFGYNEMPLLLKTNNSNSLQEQLENFTKNRLLATIDFEPFEMKGLEVIETGELEVEVEFNISTIFRLNYPLMLRDLQTGAETTISEFTASYPINFVTIQAFADTIIDKDVTDIQFDIITAKMDGFPLIGVQVLNDVYENDDLIIIEDKASKLVDRAYQFRFMRHDRPPALHYIDMPEGYEIGNGSEIRLTSEDVFEIDNTDGDDLNIEVKAYDPDEDDIIITFKKDLPFWRYTWYSEEPSPDEDDIGTTLNITVAAFQAEAFSNRTSHDWQKISLNVTEATG